MSTEDGERSGHPKEECRIVKLFPSIEKDQDATKNFVSGETFVRQVQAAVCATITPIVELITAPNKVHLQSLPAAPG
ncbi:hypothetical protein GWI33_017883 [Rhynchophorus ferrugineus]|uniref:Uncharacterized protein n=1 Tax=Rhynchophorus ferrugineus TaxID=354439 RepID=A0A834M5U5_RHYFE|nr:hypothetical protein GWI33_017883 [Rhynchophorus ferrugineus]